MLRPQGRLVTCHFCWLPNQDEIARRSEELVLKYNPQWTGGGFSGEVPREMAQNGTVLRRCGLFLCSTRHIPFTHESWRGRFRACRGVGASLSPAEVAAFDREHADLLAESVDSSFTVLHRIDCHILQPHAAKAQK